MTKLAEPSTPSGAAGNHKRRRQITSYKNTTTSPATNTAREIDLAVRDLIEAGGACARAILEKRRAELDAGVQLLMAKETLTAEDFAPLRPVGAQEKKGIAA